MSYIDLLMRAACAEMLRNATPLSRPLIEAFVRGLPQIIERANGQRVPPTLPGPPK